MIGIMISTLMNLRFFTVVISTVFLLYVGGVSEWDFGPEGIKYASANWQAPVYPQIDTTPDFVSGFGSFGINNDEFTNLAFIETNSTHLFVTQYDRHYIQIFHNNGTFAGMLGGYGHTDDISGFNSPTGMVYNGTHLLVCDTKNLRVQVFDSSGTYVSHFDMSYEYDPDMDVLTKHDITVAGSNIFIADHHTIRMYDSSGNYIKSFGDSRWGSESFTNLSAIGSNSTHIFAADAWTDDIQIFDSEGNYVSIFGGSGFKDGEFQMPSDIVYVSQYVLVSDIMRDDISIFDSDGNYISGFNGSSGGLKDGEFEFITSIASNSTHLFVLDNTRYNIQIFSLFDTIFAPNAPPHLDTIGALTVFEGSTLTFTASAVDTDAGQNMTYLLYGAPPGATITPDSGIFRWTPDESQGPGTYHITVVATDDGQYPMSDSEAVTVVVSEENQSPTLAAIGPLSVDVGATLIVDMHAIDSDIPINALVYSTNSTGGTIYDQTFIWTPTPEDAGVHTVRFTVSDLGLSDYEDVEITVRPLITNPLRLAHISTQNVSEGTELILTAHPTDAGYMAQNLTYYIDNAPPGATITPDSGIFRWTPDESHGQGTYGVTITVTDDWMQSDSISFDIVVSETNQPPMLATIGNVSAIVDVPLAIVLSATDPDVPAADELEYLVNSTFGYMHNNAFVWTPTPEDIGVHTVRFTVFDQGLADHEDVKITVMLTPNVPPVFDFIVQQQNATEGKLLTVNASATDENKEQSLTYSIQNAPPGATITPDSGIFRWTPDESHGHGTYGVTITATDDGSPPQSDSISFDIVVSETNQPPVLDTIGSQSIVVGSTLAIVLSATDLDVPVDDLKYLVNSAFGTIHEDTFTWTPTPEDVGTHVVIFTVHDGSVTVHEDVVITVLP